MGAGGVNKKAGTAGGPEGIWRCPSFSGVGDFRVGGGDLAQGAVDVIRMDGGGGTAGGGKPGGLGQEVERARVALAG